jgi:ArsR family transcriptional regulator
MNTAIYFKALSDTTRIRLINSLLHHELSVNEIVALMKMGQSGISRHLKILMDAQLLKCRRDGVWAFYSVSDVEPARKFIDSICYLFQNDSIFIEDLKKASKLIENRKTRTIQFFNTVAADWDLIRREILGNFNLNQAILQHIEPCKTAVDLGCGTGELIANLKQKASKVIGVDSSAKMLEETRKRFLSKNGPPDLRLGELEHLPLSDGEAECAIVSMVLHHISSPDAAIAEIYRTLQPGGTFIIADLDKHDNETMRKSYGDRWLGFHRHEIENFLKKNNFILKAFQSYSLAQALNLNIFKSKKISAPKHKEK